MGYFRREEIVKNQHCWYNVKEVGKKEEAAVNGGEEGWVSSAGSSLTKDRYRSWGINIFLGRSSTVSRKIQLEVLLAMRAQQE